MKNFMNVINSKDNDTVKNIRKLKEKKFRDERHKYIVEGTRIIEEALKENASIDSIVICEDCISNNSISKKMMYEIAKHKCIYVSKKIFNMLTDVSNPQGILAVINMENSKRKIDYNQDFIVALDGVQDPGNLGTILRTVDAGGLNQIIVSKETADCYNPKVVRSTMGAIFRINIIETENLAQTLVETKQNGFKILSTSLQTNNYMYDVEYNKKVLVIGNEANGVTKEVTEIADELVKIPILGKAESLNASVATGILIYEYVRRKLNK